MPSNAEMQLADDLSRFYCDPLGFVRYAFPWGKPGFLEHHQGPDKWQEEFLTRLGLEVKARGFNGITPVPPVRMLVSSGHGIGKSVLAAWVTLWIAATRPRCRGVLSASTFQQLQTRTWAAVQQWTKASLCASWFTVTGDRMWFRNQKESWFVTPQSCKEENSEAFAGQHAADSTSFYIFDEASGIPDKIFQVAEGGLTDGEPMIFLFGNPTRNQGKFFRAAFGEERQRWIRFSVDSRNSRFTNKAQIEEWIEDYGEDSDFVRVRVRGEAPRAGSTQLVPNDIVAAARKYKAEAYHALPKIMSADIARFGDDRTVIGLRQGRHFQILGKYSGLDLVQTTERIINFVRMYQPDAVVVDGDGLGAGVIDQLRYRGFSGSTAVTRFRGEELYPVNSHYGPMLAEKPPSTTAAKTRLFEFHGGARPMDASEHYNKRAEVWCKMRDWLAAGAQIPDDPEMEIDLCGLQYGYSGKGALQLERKEDMKARGLASPDFADALAMTFAVDLFAPPPKPPRQPQKPLSWCV